MAVALCFFRTPEAQILFFDGAPHPGRPLLGRTKTVSALAVLQTVRRTPLLSYSRRSGLFANQMSSSPGLVSRCVPCSHMDAPESNVW